MENKISIIVPIYNVEQFLEECVKSILNQTYQDLEVILVNDGSTDRSSEICDELAATDGRIIVFHQNNQGTSEARNTGLKLATGQYIGFVDSDDVIHPNMYEWLMAALQEEKAEVAICHERAFYDRNCNFDEMNLKHIEKVENREQLFSHFMDVWTGPINFVWNKLYNRELFDGIRFQKGIKMEDMFIQVDVLQRVTKAVWIREALYGYRQRSGSIMNSDNDDIYIYWAEALMHQRTVIYETHMEKLALKSDVYTLKMLVRLQYKAQKEGKKEIRKKLYQTYSKKIKLKKRWDKKSIRERAPVYLARLNWPLCYMCIRIADKRG